MVAKIKIMRAGGRMMSRRVVSLQLLQSSVCTRAYSANISPPKPPRPAQASMRPLIAREGALF